jgi:hypothetical protein
LEASVAVNTYVPAANPDIDNACEPVDHPYVTGALPPDTVAVAEPLLLPLQFTFVEELMEAFNVPAKLTATLSVTTTGVPPEQGR